MKKRRDFIVPMLTRLSDVLGENTHKKEAYIERTFFITVDIIIPIYNGFELLTGLLETIKQTNVSYRLFLINDGSTDKQIAPFLEEYEKKHDNVVVITNSESKGYIKAINQGFFLCTNHIVLLNSDILLPEEWLERLMQPILKDSNVASVTPFTNAGSICSFPVMNEDNKLFDGMSVNEVDSFFKERTPCYYKIPTGVGFCMAINQRAFNSVGFYDEQELMDAYGEENDWCERATKCGYYHVIADDLFVYHKHHGSYDKDKGKSLRMHNSVILSKRYPGYDRKVSMFYKSVPYSRMVNLLCMKCAAFAAKEKSYLIFTHDLTGGSSSFIEKKKEQLQKNKAVVFLLSYSKSRYELTFLYETFCYTFQFGNIGVLRALFQVIPISHVIVNSLVNYKNTPLIIKTVNAFKQEFSFELVYYVHDYFCICPSIHFLMEEKKYCGYPEQEKCCTCKAIQSSLKKYGCGSILNWRNEFQLFLKLCDDIVVFSDDSKRILEHAYGELETIRVVPHVVDYVKPVKKKEPKDKFVIGVLGNIGYEKGSSIIHEMATLIEERKLPVKIVIIGVLYPASNSSCIEVYGAYKKEDITAIAEKKEIDLFLLPSIVPETFSLTTEEAIHTGLPVAVFSLGAPAKRVSEYEHGIVIEQQNADAVLSKIQMIQREET